MEYCFDMLVNEGFKFHGTHSFHPRKNTHNHPLRSTHNTTTMDQLRERLQTLRRQRIEQRTTRTTHTTSPHQSQPQQQPHTPSIEATEHIIAVAKCLCALNEAFCTDTTNHPPSTVKQTFHQTKQALQSLCAVLDEQGANA